jgi:RNA polymerase sigma-70 factor (ECF subfamily)
VRGIDRFEGRSSLKTWIFRILVNRAKTAGAKEPRTTELNERDTVDGERFGPGGQWVDPPAPWTDDVDERLSAPELAAKVRAAVDELPASQRQVVTLRDIEGLSSVEVREMLDLSEGNQRVLLHRGRAKIRKALEQELGETR